LAYSTSTQQPADLSSQDGTACAACDVAQRLDWRGCSGRAVGAAVWVDGAVRTRRCVRSLSTCALEDTKSEGC